MSLKTLDSLTALAPGADVWIVGDLSGSKWARRIDWYLNFQLTRAEPHRVQEISRELQQVLDKWEMEAPQVHASQGSPLMVASRHLLPNSKTIQVPAANDSAEWVRSCHRVWLSLGSPKMRVFLPEGLKAEFFAETWAKNGEKNGPKADQSAPVELVTESELLNA